MQAFWRFIYSTMNISSIISIISLFKPRIRRNVNCSENLCRSNDFVINLFYRSPTKSYSYIQIVNYNLSIPPRNRCWAICLRFGDFSNCYQNSNTFNCSEFFIRLFSINIIKT